MTLKVFVEYNKPQWKNQSKDPLVLWRRVTLYYAKNFSSFAGLQI